MMRWNWNAALFCAALAMSACEGDAPAIPDEAPDAESGPGPDEDSDATSEEDDAVTAPDASSGDAASALDAEPPALADADVSDGDSGPDATAAMDGGADASASLDADGMVDANAQVDAGQPDVQAPPVCTDDCSGHGSCTRQGSATACACDTGYGGATCNVCSSGYARSSITTPCLPASAVVEVRALPPNGTCVNGAHTLLEGVDSDLSGSLEPSEVTKEQVVCKVVRSGNVLVTNAAELESLRGVTEITGSLTIKAPFVTTLEPLKMLISVGTSLLIEGSNSLVDLKGLSWLDSVGGSMTLRNNSGLVSTEGMTALRQVTGSLLVDGNAALKQLQLGPLQVVQVDVTVSNHAELASLDGTRLRSVVGALKLQSNAKLETLGALAGLKAIGGALEIRQCGALTHLRGLGLLDDVGSVTIENNVKLADVGALAALRSVRGSLTLSKLPALQLGLGTSQLLSITGHLQVQELPLLTRLGSFAQLTKIGGALVVVKTGIEELAAFPALTTLAGTSDVGLPVGCNPLEPLPPLCVGYPSQLTIGQNPALRRFGGFPLRMNGQALTVQSVSLYDDPLLAQVENLPITAVPSGLRLENLPALRALPWLSLVQSTSTITIQNTGIERAELSKLTAATNLQVTNNPALTTLSLAKLPQLTSFTISDNGALVNWESPELLRVSGGGTLARNASLTTVTAPKLNNLGSSLTVDDNDALVALPTLTFSPDGLLATVALRITNNGALRQLPLIGGGFLLTVDIVNNDALISIPGFTADSAGLQVRIEDNDALPSLAGMQGAGLFRLLLVGNDSLTSLTTGPTFTASALEVRDHPALTSVAGVGLGSSFILVNNDALTGLDGLLVGANTSVATLRLDDNAALVSLAGLNNVTMATSTLSIQNNAALPQCAAMAFSTRVGGNATRTITGNNTSATCP